MNCKIITPLINTLIGSMSSFKALSSSRINICVNVRLTPLSAHCGPLIWGGEEEEEEEENDRRLLPGI